MELIVCQAGRKPDQLLNQKTVREEEEKRRRKKNFAQNLEENKREEQIISDRRFSHTINPPLTGMTEDRIHRANGHQIVTFDAATCVEDEHHQTFTFRIEVWMIGNVRFPIGGCLVWCFAMLHVVGGGTFPE